ncbi:hypothetical protein ACFLQL_00270 [Verrucomicrobiota bacterium]
MRIKGKSNIGIKGSIKADFVDSKGNRIPLVKKSNVITYSGADLMARAIGDDTDYIPRHMGFLYGGTLAPALTDPADLPAATKRIHTWDVITNDASSITANVLVAPLVLAPSWESSAAVYAGNMVTISSFTGAFLEYAFPTAVPFADEVDTISPVYFYHALLLNRRTVGSSVIYTPFARVSLADSGVFREKPAGFELAIYWTLEFT